jgi:hypothetical protein
MLLFDMAFQFTAGATCALGARDELTDERCPPTRTAAYRAILLYSMFLYVPSAIAFFYAWPGWDTMYLLDLESNRVVGLAAVWLDSALLCGCGILGFRATVAWLRKGGGRAFPILLRLLAIWAAVGVILVPVLWGRSFTVTSYSAFIAGEWPRFDFRWGAEDSFFGRPIMWCLLSSGVIDILPLYFIYRHFRGRKPQPVAAPAAERCG